MPGRGSGSGMGSSVWHAVLWEVAVPEMIQVALFSHAQSSAWPSSSAPACGIGYIAWSWTGNNADTAQLDLAADWEGPLTPWGESVLLGENGITETSVKASIFE